MLRLKDLTIKYKKTVVSNMSLTVEQGSWVSLIGPNGAGKSSLLKAIAGLQSYEGSCSFSPDEKEVPQKSRAKQVAYLAQKMIFPEGMTVREYVLLGRTAHIGWFGQISSSDKEIADEAMELLDVLEYAERFVTELSGGEAQRVALARVICQESPLLLLDEPITAVDIGQQQQILDKVEMLRVTKGLTIVSALHDLTLAGSYSSQLVLLQNGKVVKSGEPLTVLQPDILSSVYNVKITIVEGPQGESLICVHT